MASEFYAQHNAGLPDLPGPALPVNIGCLGLRYPLEHGGPGYFSLRLVKHLIADGRLTRIADAPDGLLPVPWTRR